MPPTIDLPRLLAAELVLRDLTIPDLAKKAEVSARSLRRYIAGESPLPPDCANVVLNVLVRLDSFYFREVHGWLVRRSGATPMGDDRGVPVRAVMVDTVQVDLEVPEGQEATACAVVERLVGRPLKRRSLSGKGLASSASGGMRFWLDGRRLRVQGKPRLAHHGAAIRELRRNLTRYGSLPAKVTISRLDVAVDYAVHPSWILVQRPRVRTATRWESSEGGVTYYLGTRAKAEVFVRVYDAATLHQLPSPTTRVEVELKPRQPPTLLTLDELGGLLTSDESGPGRAFKHWMTPLYAVELTPLERALVAQGREEGMPWFKRKLAPKQRRVLNGALAKLQAARPLSSPDRVLGWLDGGSHPVFWLALADRLRADLSYSPEGFRWDGCEAEDHEILAYHFTRWVA